MRGNQSGPSGPASPARSSHAKHRYRITRPGASGERIGSFGANRPHQLFGPAEADEIDGTSIALVQGVDRLLDMARTTVNVVGDLVIATCVGDLEKDESAGDP